MNRYVVFFGKGHRQYIGMKQGKPQKLATLATSCCSGKEMKLHDTIRERDLSIVYIIFRSYSKQK